MARQTARNAHPKNGKLRLVYLDPAELQANPHNWREHPKAQQTALVESIEDVGWAGALLFNERTKRLIDGHARKELFAGKRVPVLVGSWSPAQEKKILATLDPLAGMATANTDALDKLLKSLAPVGDGVQKMLDELARESGLAQHDYTDVDADVEEVNESADEDGLDLLFKSPYPYFGGKARIAKMVWSRFGDVRGYIEPFYGSGAVLLNRPQPFEGTETINDMDALLCNFWRAVKHDPDKVADAADWPVNESDLHARHAWLIGQKERIVENMEGDPDWFDAKAAGWWCWGMACWIGARFCAGDGPWQVVEKNGERQLVHLGDAGRGVNRQRVHLGNAGQGVKRQLVHLGAGRGVNRKLVHLSDAGRAAIGECGLLNWIRALSERFQRVRVCCGDWKRICGGQSGDALQHFFSGGQPCGVFLDPPYKLNLEDGSSNRGACYNTDGADTTDIAEQVCQWAVNHGDDSRLRIALCGYEGEYKMPKSWTCVAWKAHGGMAGLAKSDKTQGKANKYRERVWFSPHCVKPEKRR